LNSSAVRIGTRASPLARWQANWVADQLRALQVTVELVLITTQGDVQQQGPIGDIGTSGVFTKELQRALLDNRIDLAVHSLKDLPTDVVPGLSLAAVPVRESHRDALLSRTGLPLLALPAGAKIGTGSMRRSSQLLHARQDLQIADVRGNVDTRLRKLHDGEYDALILAEAGLRRLGLDSQITELLPLESFLPAIGQGALGLETRENDTATRALLQPIDDPATHASVLAERAMLAALRGGCLAPIGGWARIDASGKLHLEGTVLNPSGTERRYASAGRAIGQPVQLGQQVAKLLLDQGAAELINSARKA